MKKKIKIRKPRKYTWYGNFYIKIDKGTIIIGMADYYMYWYLHRAKQLHKWLGQAIKYLEQKK